MSDKVTDSLPSLFTSHCHSHLTHHHPSPSPSPLTLTHPSPSLTPHPHSSLTFTHPSPSLTPHPPIHVGPSAVASDGRFLYILTGACLRKVGTGYGGTVQGHVYKENTDFMADEPDGWLGFAAVSAVHVHACLVQVM